MQSNRQQILEEYYDKIFTKYPDNIKLKELGKEKFIKLFFDAPYFQDFILNNATGTAQKGFYLNQLEGVLVCVPPADEQKRLSDKIQQLLSNIQYIEKSLS